VAAWIVVFWRLGYASLLDPDEAHYAELTREMLHAGNWLVPLLDGRPLIDKPVLFHWLQGASVWLLGETELAARLPSALAALALFTTTRWAGITLLGAEAGEWGAIMFATIPATFALSSVALFDMVFSAFLFGGIACLLVGAIRARRRTEMAGYALLTFAVMTKGPVALVLVGGFLGAAALAGRDTREIVRRLRWKTGLTCVVAAASPWFVWMSIHFGDEFVRGYLLAGNVWYFTQPAVFSGRAVSHTFYVRAFAGAFFPWSVVLVGRAIDLVRKPARDAMSTDEKLLFLWVAVITGFFTAARFKLDHYIYPAAPACCLIAAHAWYQALGDTGRSARFTRISVFAIAGVMIVAGSFGSVLLFRLNLELPASAILLPLALLAGGIALMTLSAQRHWNVPRSPAVPAATLVAAYVVVVAVGYPVLEHTRPTAIVARALRETTSASTPVAIYRLERWRASLRYYLDRPVGRLENPDELRAYLTQPRAVYVVLLRKDYDALRADGVPLHSVYRRRAVEGTEGKGLRRQRWGYLMVASNVPHHQHPRSSAAYRRP
jgi:4-amino-4-deoxy-L-arabinose transferase-like glycosyltransferase